MKENLDAAKSIIEAVSSNVWTAIIGVFILTCFWMTLIYLRAPSFYHPAPVYIFIITAFSLAICWYLGAMIGLSFLFMKDDKSIDHVELLLKGSVYAIFMLGMLLAYSYFFSIRFRFSLQLGYSALIGTFISNYGSFLISSLKRNRKEKTTPAKDLPQ
ncbi:hypothetical protein GO730_00395 [Spirosoma sp. HMF3257]|uniref:Uncharacterized protein n=1 Tax=Spirosoma telluris TaxID=2183553 RepID=A0A327NDT6_9BACT|nr:hypothetical protein [Spirosoma telluris]RAI73262.1 hypothetical protein HMF3257_00380 [Spirosoma telluris]